MNCSIKKAFLFFLMIASGHHTSQAYELFFSNFTGKFLIIASKQRTSLIEKGYQVVAPGGSVIQTFNNANCLESLQWTEVDTTLPLRGGLDLVDKEHGYQIPHDKQSLFDATFFNKRTGRGLYLWNNLAIKIVPNELYQKTVQAAVELTSSFTSLLNETKKATVSSTDNVAIETIPDALYQKAITAAKTFTDSPTFTSRLEAVTQAAGNIAGIDICKHRQFSILDTGELDPLTRQPKLIAVIGEGE